MTHNFVIPETARELVSQWDSGETIWSIEMGGLGPGYEQAIQILAVEITRDNLDKQVPNPAPSDWGHDTCDRIDKPLPDGTYSCGGFSGARRRKYATRFSRDQEEIRGGYGLNF